MAEEYAGLLLGGTLLALASVFSGNGENDAVEVGDREIALKKFNEAQRSAASNNKRGEKLILAASYGSGYNDLQTALSKIGIFLEVESASQFGTLNLRSLLKTNPSFEMERKIQEALVEEGIVMIPGEAYGAKEPGYFRINVPFLSKEQIESIVDKIWKVAKKFNTELGKRPAAQAEKVTNAPPVAVDVDETASVADSVNDGATSSKKRRTKKAE